MIDIPAEFEKLRLEILKSLKEEHPDWDEKKLDSMSYATATAQWKKSHEGEAPKEHKFFSKQFYSVKEQGEDYYMTFIVASTHPDNAVNDTFGVEGDIITKECLESMANKWNSTNLKGSIHHKISPEIASVGQHDARVVSMPKRHEGLLATAKANKFLNDENIKYNFDRFKSEIEDRVLDGVSIEYRAKDYDIINKEGHNYRLLKDIELLGYGHASRPVNEEAKVIGFGFKELNIEVKEIEEKAMVTDMESKREKMGMSVSEFYAIPRDPPSESKLPMFDEAHVRNAMARFNQMQGVSEEEKKSAMHKLMAKAKKLGIETENFGDSKKSNKEQSEDKMDNENKEMTLTKEQVEEFKAFQEAKSKANIESKEKELETKMNNWIEEKMKKMAPLLNPGSQFDATEVKEMPAIVEYKEALKSGSISDQWSAAHKLADAIGFERLWNRTLSKEKNVHIQNFECKGNKIVPKTMEVKEMASMRGIEVKNLTTTQNAEATYYQSAAEIADVYEPIIYNQFNDEALTFGRIPKVSYADRPRIQFVIGTARNTTAGGYASESTTSYTAGQQERIKCEQGWATYRVVCTVSNLELAETVGRGGTITADIWGEELRRATVDLAVQINTDIVHGAAGTYDGTSGTYLLGFQKLIATSGNLYGKARSSYATLQGNYEAMSSANLSLDQMRKMIDTVMVNGARRNNIVFTTSYTLLRKYRQILQSMQKLEVYSNRAGFTDMLEFDGVPLMPDPNADADDLFLWDTDSVKCGIKLAPTVADLTGSDFDGKRGYIKTYFNIYATYPNRNYWCSGFATA